MTEGIRFRFSRRDLLRMSAATVVSATAGTAFAPRARADDVVLSDREILAYLDDSAWVPDGRPNDRHIYIASAPWCPNCKVLYKRLRPHSGNGVQFRWLQGFSRDRTSELQNMAFAARRDPRDLGAIYGSGKMAGADQADARWVADWNDGVINALRHTMKGRLGRFPTPVTFWPTTSGLKAALGSGIDIDGVLKEVTARPEARDIVPAATRFPGTVASEKSISPTQLFASRGDVPLHAVPGTSAPVVWVLKARTGAQVGRVATTRDGRQWAFFGVWKSGSVLSGGWGPLDDLYLKGGRKAVL